MNFFKTKFEPKIKIKVRTAWVHDNAFFVLVKKYELKTKFFVFNRWVEVEEKKYASWESLMRNMWYENWLPSDQYIMEIGSKI